MASTPASLYRPSLALLTDLYQLTMAQGYWALGQHQREAVFHLFFRSNPFKGGYTIACGLADAIAWLESVRFDESDLAYLKTLHGADSRPLFRADFLTALRTFAFTLDIDAIPEGTAVFPYEPLIRVRGPLWQAQLAETALLNIINFQTLIATKAARVCDAAHGQTVVEFGLRRAQGIDGGLSASRAAYIGGCAATSNTFAGRMLGIPVRGTHAHSWVMSFDTEREAFDHYVEAMPNNAVLLVDTYDTLQGVRNAAAVGLAMKERGHKLLGIRLDSGDLAYLSVEARKILDAAGLTDATITASNDLDEHTIASLRQQGARIDTWGVGTNLVTGGDQAALGGVYKLSALREPDGSWTRKLKLSEHLSKASLPGVLNVRRFKDAGGPVADAIYDELLGCPEAVTVIDPRDPTRTKPISHTRHEDLLLPFMRSGRRVADPEPLTALRDRARAQVAALHQGIRRLLNPHAYPAGLELGLHELRVTMIAQSRSHAATPATSHEEEAR
jgi:nicotinate phosphoribosyltransferase